MLERLRELRKELTEFQYVLLVNSVIQNMKYHEKIGTKYDDESIIDLINITVPVVKKF